MATPTAAAEFIAPLGAPLFCPLEKTVLVITRRGTERCLTVWTKPNDLAAVIKARRALAPGWAIQETLCDYPMEVA
ncbi:hypothetical protein D0962_09600 [Leptolyngbyaceae cyanobacterium CCMR0082]|uniref:Uncharacterized protein n=1 Tax=Adonisia turfae CCMR0082 TaxID=2304604 RepID=A0A6M0S5C6_9CYAN|nr:hypothetical protein [Adonisia turfae]NEZ63032.1 hypothetical protein [Adonisia turfae CCMR0082]